MRQFLACAAAIVGLAIFITPASAGERVALVIGNSNYSNFSPLANPQNDARLMGETLQRSGFTVKTLVDAEYDTLKRAMLEFGRTIRERDTEAALFYYAGHGVQVKGENYLIPVNANVASEDEVELEAININDFLGVMESSKSGVNIVILDACRNNPFSSSGRSATRGLAPVDAPKGSYIAYATAPGQVALDGEGGNSPYTKALTEAMAEPGLPIERVFKRARAKVQAETGASQVPWETSSITGEFFFKGQGLATVEVAPKSDDVRVTDPNGTSIFDSLTIKKTPEGAKQKIKDDAIANLQIPGTALESPRFDNETCLDLDIGGALCVSSVLKAEKGNKYGPENLADEDPKTAWVEGVEGDGIGETIVVRFNQPEDVKEIGFRNGYTKNNDIFAKNNRVSAVVIKTSSGYSAVAELVDNGETQTVDLSQQNIKDVSWIAIEIFSVFQGSKYSDTAISEFWVQ